MKRIKGLDTLRFVAATWVVFSHFGGIPLPDTFGRAGGARLVRGAYNVLVSGPAAVIVFFVISGFCIHYPYRNADRVNLLAFYSRRHVRILTPVAVAIALSIPLKLELLDLNHAILWSLLCEEIYYTIYPLLLIAKRRLGWKTLIGASYVFSYAAMLTNVSALDYPSFGAGLNWIVGLPCWLLGAALADRIDDTLTRDATPSAVSIWTWRAGALGLSAVACGLRFHTPIGYPWTLNLFALFCTAWLRKEIVRAERIGVSPLERAGVFSYSIYLVHPHAEALWKLLGISFAPAVLESIVRNIFIIAVCFVFYLVVEKPAHTLARRIHVRVMARYQPT
jgi:peptidoglycan/LPS O-acetylase OafA/YrhL